MISSAAMSTHRSIGLRNSGANEAASRTSSRAMAASDAETSFTLTVDASTDA